MRTIKFRAWDKQSKQMFDVYSIEFRKDGLHVNLDTPCKVTGLRESWLYGERLEIMQFTGLLDKNGKEIYEGDIVMLNCGADNGATIRHKITASIEWYTNRWIANIPDKKVVVKGGIDEGKKLSWREIHTWCGMHNCLSDTWVKREVIGNIYENPELLKA